MANAPSSLAKTEGLLSKVKKEPRGGIINFDDFDFDPELDFDLFWLLFDGSRFSSTSFSLYLEDKNKAQSTEHTGVVVVVVVVVETLNQSQKQCGVLYMVRSNYLKLWKNLVDYYAYSVS